MSERKLPDLVAGSDNIGRKEWVKPTVRVLSAGSAELTVGAIDDLVDYS